MDFPVTAEFAATANAGQLHAECRGASVEWPASFVDTGNDWVYRIVDVDHYLDDEGEPQERPVDGVVVDVQAVEAALAAHVPEWVPSATPEEKIAELEDAVSTLTDLVFGLL